MDDDANNRDLLGRRLEQQGFDVRLAVDGPDALRVLAEESVDAVLLDVMMPGQSGLEVLTAIRSDPRTKELPVIMVTARGDSQDVVEALDLGASDYITKPIDFSVAMARVRAQLGRVTAERAALALQRHYDLQHAQKLSAIGLLAGGVAHDFNNLLTAIQGYGEFLLDDLGPGDARRQHVTHILRAADSAAGLTRQLLAFSRRQAAAPERLDPGGITRDMARLLRRVIGDRIALTVDVPEGIWPILGDAGQYDQVLLNLVVNACDAMPDGGTLRIAVENEPSALPGQKDAVALTVTDTGCGIDDAALPHIFEPFFTTKGPGQGTGLGLSMVRTIAELFGGAVDVASRRGEGTRFRVRLPRAMDAPPVAGRPPSGAAAHPASGVVLLVEDDPAVRRVVRQWLERTGYRVLEAANADEASALAGSLAGPIDLLVTDISMPGTEGPELWQALRRVQPGLEVVFMSAYDTVGQEAHRLAGRPILQKPFQSGVLLRAVHAAIDGARAPTAGA
ncbi:MAG: response regulator [Vicinamibacterales bacterium]